MVSRVRIWLYVFVLYPMFKGGLILGLFELRYRKEFLNNSRAEVIINYHPINLRRAASRANIYATIKEIMISPTVSWRLYFYEYSENC